MTMNRNDLDRLLKKAHFRSSSSFKPAPITTSHGFASIIQQEDRTDVVPLSEQRDLSKLTDTLTDYILECCTLDAHNRAQELQIEWFDNNTDRNVSTIERLFRTEIQSKRQMIDNNQRTKSELEKQLENIQEATTANQQYYQQMLAKRNALHKDLVTYQRQLAQTRAESEFVRNRIQLYNEEIQYYKLKTPLLEARKEKFQIDIDDELFSRQVLQMEYETLENEKITNEDLHLILIEDLRSSIQQTTALRPSAYFREQLIHQIRQMRIEYNKKLETYRVELHRQFELAQEKYSIDRTDENLLDKYERKLDEYRRENNKIEQEISSIRSGFHQLEHQMTILADNIEQIQQETDVIDHSQRQLNSLNEVLQAKEQQLNEAIRMRNQLKEQIEFYRNEVDTFRRRSSLIEQPKKSILRRSQSQNIKTDPSTVDEDCQQLNYLFQQTIVDSILLINILCRRNVVQRLQIRDTFKNRYDQNLGNLIDTKIAGNSKKFLKLLLLSPVEFDCYEFRRLMRTNYFDENIVIELLLSRSTKHIRSLIQTYLKLFKSTLKQDILDIGDNSSKQIFISLLEINRSEGMTVNQSEIINDARYLSTTSSKWKKDGSTFVQLIAKRSNEQLKLIFDAYQRFSNVDIEQTIKIDTDLSLSRTLMAIVRIVRNQPRFFAYELRKSLRDSKMNEDHLNRIIITRCEIDMKQIQSEYEKISKYTLYDQIQIDIEGDYRRAISELIHVDLPKQTRRTLSWKERTSSDSDVSQFDRNNYAKSNTLARLETMNE